VDFAVGGGRVPIITKSLYLAYAFLMLVRLGSNIVRHVCAGICGKAQAKERDGNAYCHFLSRVVAGVRVLRVRASAATSGKQATEFPQEGFEGTFV
jgi:hypothetical protein